MAELSGVKVCENCNKKFVPRTTWQTTCTKSCYHLKKAKELKGKKNASTSKLS